jgi:hypothetical protein
MTLSAKLPFRRDAEQVRLSARHSVHEHVDDLWPQGEHAATPEWIRAHVNDILVVLEQAFGIGRHRRPSSLLRVPRRMHWLLWLLAELDKTQ